MFYLAVPCILTKRALSLPIHKNQSDKSDKVEVFVPEKFFNVIEIKKEIIWEQLY
jgi:hypothetical protein